MTVSILVPVYNVSQYLERCLDSLLGQTYRDIEVVAINDGSTDDSLAKLLAYQKKDPRLRVYSYSNSGISKTRNRALAKARGEYILFVDSDDYIEKNMVSLLVDAAKARDLDVVQCNFVMDFGPIPFFRQPTGRHVFDTRTAMHMLAKEKYLNNYPWGKLYKRECFAGIQFPENMKGFEDTCTIFKAIAKARRVGTIPEHLYHYEQRFGSLTNCMSLQTVYMMRHAYQYQAKEFARLFDKENFSFEKQYYNTDMVLIYTLLVFSRRKDKPKFVPADINWKELPFYPVLYAAYYAWLGLALLKLSPDILKVDARQKELLKYPPANLDLNALLEKKDMDQGSQNAEGFQPIRQEKNHNKAK